MKNEKTKNAKRSKAKQSIAKEVKKTQNKKHKNIRRGQNSCVFSILSGRLDHEPILPFELFDLLAYKPHNPAPSN
jgi:hypothetical protein